MSTEPFVSTPPPLPPSHSVGGLKNTHNFKVEKFELALIDKLTPFNIQIQSFPPSFIPTYPIYRLPLSANLKSEEMSIIKGNSSF